MLQDSSMIADHELVDDLERVAKKAKIPYQRCVLPRGGHISWEGHLFGFLGGIAAARIMRSRRAR